MKKYILFILLFMVLTSCSDEWLEIEPKNELTSSMFYRNEADAIASITSAYDPLHSFGTYAVSIQYVSYAHDDRVLWEKPYWNDLMFKSNESRIEDIYMYIFRGIYRVNMALENIPGIVMDESLKERLLAEAKFLRAFYYFHLRVYFNEPPLVLKVIKIFDEAKLPNTPAAEIWAQIETDLMDAISGLPLSYSPDNAGRATKGAALALLGKSYLFQEKWTQAEETLGQVIDLNVYQLSMPVGNDSIDYVNAYLCNFTPEAMPGSSSNYMAENNSESVFEIQNNADPTWWNAYIGGYGNNGTLLSAYFSIIGWKNVVPTAEFAAQFEEAPAEHPAGLKYDPRKYASVFAEGDTIENREEGLQYYNVPFDPVKHSNLVITEGFQIRKYYYPLHSKSADSPYIDPNNWRYIRYADVLLMYAEAEFQMNGSTPLAVNAINQVRARVGMPPVTEVSPEVIMHERDVELGLECVRFLDLVRWSMLPAPWVNPADMISGFVTGKNEYLPIPLVEITKSEGLLKQNPGW